MTGGRGVAALPELQSVRLAELKSGYIYRALHPAETIIDYDGSSRRLRSLLPLRDVPKGAVQQPYAEAECKVTSVEPKAVVGGSGGQLTAQNDVWV